jgi:hypothetical protein
MRAITADEASVVRWLLTNSNGLNGLAASVDELKVVAGCECPCLSVDFKPEGRTSKYRILSEGIGTADNGEHLEVVLWGNDKEISALEIIKFSEQPLKKLPAAGTLKTWEQAGEALKRGNSA